MSDPFGLDAITTPVLSAIMTPVTRSRTVKPTFIEFRRKKHVKPLKPPPRPPGIPSGRERMRKLLEALEGPTPPFERRETREERLRACYYLIVNMINVKQSVGSMFPIFRLGFWSHRQARKSRCCGHRVAKGMTHIAVVEENNHVRWVVHYDCFKRFIDIKHPRFANRLAIKHNDEELQDILRNDFEVQEHQSGVRTKVSFTKFEGESNEKLGYAAKISSTVLNPSVAV